MIIIIITTTIIITLTIIIMSISPHKDYGKLLPWRRSPLFAKDRSQGLDTILPSWDDNDDDEGDEGGDEGDAGCDGDEGDGHLQVSPRVSLLKRSSTTGLQS